jgi:transposase
VQIRFGSSDDNGGGARWRRDTRKTYGSGSSRSSRKVTARGRRRLLNVSASTAIRSTERWTTTGSVEVKPGTGRSRSSLNKHEQWLLDLIAAAPDLTLDDIRLRLSDAKKLKAGTSSMWRFYDRR